MGRTVLLLLTYFIIVYVIFFVVAKFAGLEVGMASIGAAILASQLGHYWRLEEKIQDRRTNERR